MTVPSYRKRKCWWKAYHIPGYDAQMNVTSFDRPIRRLKLYWWCIEKLYFGSQSQMYRQNSKIPEDGWQVPGVTIYDAGCCLPEQTLLWHISFRQQLNELKRLTKACKTNSIFKSDEHNNLNWFHESSNGYTFAVTGTLN